MSADRLNPVRVVVYGSSCPACTQAKAVLNRFRVGHEEQLMSEFPRRLGVVRSMPQITIDGELLGGINQLLKLARAGGLERIANNDSQPWVRVKRQLGRGYSVSLLDALGRELVTRSALTKADAARIAGELAAGSGAEQSSPVH